MSQAHVLRGNQWVATEGNQTDDTLQENAQEAFPYLEKISMTARRNPYAMLTIIVSIASVVVIAVTTLSVSIIGSVFIMYGKMNKMEADQAVIIKSLDKRETEDKVTRTYEASVLSRQNYMVGLMDGKQKAAMNAYDKSNPIRFPSDEPKKPED